MAGIITGCPWGWVNWGGAGVVVFNTGHSQQCFYRLQCLSLSLNFSLSSTSSSVQLEQPVLQASFWILQYQNDGHREVGQGTGWVGQGLGLQAKDSLLRGVVVDVQELLTW